MYVQLIVSLHQASGDCTFVQSVTVVLIRHVKSDGETFDKNDKINLANYVNLVILHMTVYCEPPKNILVCGE